MRLKLLLFVTLAAGATALPGQWKSVAALEKEIAETLDASWEVKSIKTNKGVMKIQTGNTRVPELMYRAALPTICYIIQEKGGSPEIKQIQLLNSFGRQGYVYERATKCRELLEVGSRNLKLFILSDTHLFRYGKE